MKFVFILLIIFIHVGCRNEHHISPYLGQKPPGTDPEVFAPGIVSTDDHIEMGCAWTPDGKEFYFDRSVARP